VRVLVHNSTRRHYHNLVFGESEKYFTFIELFKDSALKLSASHSSCFSINICHLNTRYLVWFGVMVSQSMLGIILMVKLGRNPN
jgi:hypothetical protein